MAELIQYDQSEATTQSRSSVGQKYIHVIFPKKTSLLIAPMNLFALVSKPAARVLRFRTKSRSATPFTHQNNAYLCLPKMCREDIHFLAVKNVSAIPSPGFHAQSLSTADFSNARVYRRLASSCMHDSGGPDMG